MNQQAMNQLSHSLKQPRPKHVYHSCPNGSALPGSTKRNTTLGIFFLFLCILSGTWMEQKEQGCVKPLVYTPLKVNSSPQHIQAPVSKNQLKTVPLMEICLSQASVP